MTPQSKRFFEFGDFVFDVTSGELTSKGVRVKVNKQVADMLSLLIKNAGQLVTRDQIREALWPGQEFIHHEKIISNVVSRLRLTLNDDPNQPRFIESIPKRGYRWLETLETAPSKPAESSPAEPPSIQQPLLSAAPLASFPEVAAVPPAIASPIVPENFREKNTSQFHRGFLYIAIALLMLFAAGLWFYRKERGKPVEAVQASTMSLGIAPFETDTHEAKNLADSFRLDLTDSLAQLPQINVRAAHSLERLSQDPATFAENTRRLGLDVILFGKLKIEGKRCTLQFELVRSKDLSHLSSFSFSGAEDELTRLRDQIQMEIFSQLNPSSLGTLHLDASRSPGNTPNRQAYAFYLRAGLDLAQQTPASLQAALRGYRDAVAADPEFGRAYSHMARTWMYLGEHGLVPREQSLNEAWNMVTKALTLDPYDADAHNVRGLIYMLRDWNLRAAEQELQQAVILAPNQPLHHQGLSLVYCEAGRFRDSLSEIDIAHSQDPDWVSAYITDAHVSAMARNDAHAMIAIHHLIQIVPGSSHALDAIANAQWYLGHYAEAIASWRAMAVLDGDTKRVALEDRGAAALRSGGPTAYARLRLEAISEGGNGTPHANDFDSPEWYTMAGENDQALTMIRRNVASHDLWMLELGISPAYDGLRKNPEFQAILASRGM